MLTSYVIAAAIMTAPVGWLAARFGRKNLFIVCLVGFTVASMLCGAAQSLTQMVVFRFMQGICGAALVPLSQATMLDIYPFEQRAQAMAILGMGVMVGPITGSDARRLPDRDATTGAGCSTSTCRSASLAITGLLVVPAARRCQRRAAVRLDRLRRAGDRHRRRCSSCSTAAQEQDWFTSREIIIEAVLAGARLLSLRRAHVHRRAAVPAAGDLFQDRNFVAGATMMFFIGMVLLASSALMAPYLQTLAGYPVATAGLAMAPRGIGTMVAMHDRQPARRTTSTSARSWRSAC